MSMETLNRPARLDTRATAEILPKVELKSHHIRCLAIATIVLSWGGILSLFRVI